MKNIYKRMYGSHNLQYLEDNRRLHLMAGMVNDLRLHKRNILDIGCHDGTFLFSIRREDNSLFGIDASDYAVKKAKKRNISAKRFFFDGKEKFPFRNKMFDLIIAGEIIEHVYDTDFFIREVRRLLKDKGYLLISTPNIVSFGRRIMLFFGINPFLETSPNEENSVGHIRYFTFDSLKQHLNKHHFQIILKKSDHINISSRGLFSLTFVSRLFPTFGSEHHLSDTKNLIEKNGVKIRMKNIALITINYNGQKLLKDYHTSVFAQSQLPDEVILLDNASTDNSCEYVRKYFPQVRIIQSMIVTKELKPRKIFSKLIDSRA